jgi:PAS domain S-box-containing protein
MNFTITQEQLNKVFPYHIIFDENFNIESCSKKVFQLAGPINGSLFSSIFLVKSADEKSTNSNLSDSLIGQFFYLQLISYPEILFFGKLERFGLENQTVFYGDMQNVDSNFNDEIAVYRSKATSPVQLAINRLIVDEKRYRDLYAYSPALIYKHNLDGKLISCNPAAKSILGFKDADIVGVNIQDLLPAFDRRYFQGAYLDKIINEGSGKGVFRILPKHGDQILYMHYHNYKVQESESVSYIIGFSQDITDRIKTEKELRFAKLTSENLAKQKEYFLANMSHEIRTPINGILGLNNLLMKTNLDEKQEHYVKLSSESINNLLILINDILDTEKIGFGKVGFESHPFNISHKIERTIQLFQHKAKESGLEIVLKDYVDKDLIVVGDQYRFSQILSNLLSNAIKFTKVGSVVVTVNTILDLEDKVKISFSVKDTGIGVSEKNLSEIFKPFVQASLSTTRNYGGTGLGLSICKKLIDMQGGHIKVYSKLGVGTEFVFTLTYKKDAARHIVEAKSAEIDYAKLKGKRVLVGEDVDLNQFLIRNILESWGCETDIVGDGIKIIKKLEENDYDIILMDIQMPEMDGLTAAKYIRGMDDKKKADIPIVAFTAGAMQGEIQKYQSVKMNDFILKPYSEKYLFDKLVSVLNLNTVAETADSDEDIKESLTSLYDLSEIRSLSKNDDALFNKVISLLISMLSTEKENIKKLAKEDNWAEVSEIVHKIKTSLIHIKVTSLTQIIKDLEYYEPFDSKQLNVLVKQLCETLDNILVFLKIDMEEAMSNS